MYNDFKELSEMHFVQAEIAHGENSVDWRADLSILTTITLSC
jgi:hypothetical protein